MELKDRFNQENVTGFKLEELAELNRIYNEIIADLPDALRNNSDLLQHISEEVLTTFARVTANTEGHLGKKKMRYKECVTCKCWSCKYQHQCSNCENCSNIECTPHGYISCRPHLHETKCRGYEQI